MVDNWLRLNRQAPVRASPSIDFGRRFRGSIEPGADWALCRKRANAKDTRSGLKEKNAMASIAIKRVYEKRAPSDGIRILVDRLWPRGVSKAAAGLDFWCKEVAPSTALRTWFGHREDRFTDFKKRYLLELRSNPAVPQLVAKIGRRRATLLYAAHDETVNHAVVLAGYLRNYRSRPVAPASPKARTARSGVTT
jgi:uncharacterized protein YeaO (DUF488 family)